MKVIDCYGQEWGEIEHPYLGNVMRHCLKGTPCYDTCTAPIWGKTLKNIVKNKNHYIQVVV